jgi:hypothetical protein
MRAEAQLTIHHNRSRIFSNAAYIAGSVLVLVLFSSANRPIWYDEMVVFTFAGLPDLATVVHQVFATTTNLNLGQTGTYLLAEYVSVNLFGASWVSMRLPSLLCAIWALAALYVFLRARQVQPILIALTPLMCLGYPTLWYFAGEARPYMPLVAAVLGVTAYYSLQIAQRSRVIYRALGWGSVILGATGHPYFLLYWPALIVFFATVGYAGPKPQLLPRSLLRFANTPLLVAGLSIGVLVGALTWMRGNIEQAVPWDAWLTYSLPQELARSLLWPFFDSGLLGAVALLLLVSLVVARLAQGRRKWVTPPLALMALSVALALIVSTASILNEFWVFPRQWVASQALTLCALIWLASQTLVGVRGQRDKVITTLTLVVVGLALFPAVARTALWKASDLRAWHQVAGDSPYRELEQRQLRNALDSGIFPSDRRWAEFSQANLVQGGKIWPELGRYYTDRDWTNVSLEMKSPSDLFLD